MTQSAKLLAESTWSEQYLQLWCLQRFI